MKKYKLLPHIKENLYGINTNAIQMIPWSIKQFEIENVWQKSTGKDLDGCTQKSAKGAKTSSKIDEQSK